MNKLKELTEKRYSLVAKMEAAVERREYESYDKFEAELRELDAEILAIKQKQESKIQTATEDNLIRAEELTETQFVRAFAPEESTVGFEDFTRAVLFNDGGEFRATTTVDGSVIIPTSIAAQVIHKALNNSVLLRKTPVLSMEAPTAIIGRVKDNVKVDFKEKMATGLQTGLGLEGVKLEAKTLYAWVKIAEEDLQDLVNLQSILHTAFAGAVAETIDKNFLYTNPNAAAKPGVYPKGIMDSETINSLEVAAIDYDAILKGSSEIANNNGEANAVGIHPSDEFGLYMLKDNSGQYIQPPLGLPVGPYTRSNGMKPGDVLIFDKNAIVVGIRREMDVKVMSDLTDGTVLMRVMFRCDVATTQDKHICKVTKAVAK